MFTFLITIPKGMVESFKTACLQRHFVCTKKTEKNGIGAYTLFEIAHKNPNNEITGADLFWLGAQTQLVYGYEH